MSKKHVTSSTVTRFIVVFLLFSLVFVLSVSPMQVPNEVKGNDGLYDYYGNVYIYNKGYAGFWAWFVFYYHSAKPYRVPPLPELNVLANKGVVSDLQFWIGQPSYIVICDTTDGSLHSFELKPIRISRDGVVLAYYGNKGAK